MGGCAKRADRGERAWNNCLLGLMTGLLAMAALVYAGCQPAAATRSSAAPAANGPAADRAQPSTREASSSSEPERRESWDVFYIADSKIGYGWTRYETVLEDGQKLVRITSEQELSVKRFGQTVTVRNRLISWESPEGRVARFSSEMSDGGATIASRGRYESGKLLIELKTQGKAHTETLSWDPSWGGFFSVEQRLEQKPMEPGEKRSFMALAPAFNQVAQVRLEATDYERTELLAGARELLRIKGVIQLDSGPIESVMWTDRKGETLKTLLPSLKQVSYRTTKEVALAKAASAGSFDLGRDTVVTVTRELERPHETQRIVYRARLPNGDPAAEFAAGSTQQIRRIDEHTAEITVRAVRPGSDQAGFPQDRLPGDAERMPNNFLQSDDPQIVAMAATVAPKESDPWVVACALEKFVRDTVRSQSFSPAMATAADVARSREGDCTEHAVLLAALCRARQIPARIAIGLVYYRPARGFAYHMWTEAWIGQRWIPIDGTLGSGGIGAGHIKITHSNLAGTDSLGAFLPVFRLLGQLQLEIVSVTGPAEASKDSK